MNKSWGRKFMSLSGLNILLSLLNLDKGNIPT